VLLGELCAAGGWDAARLELREGHTGGGYQENLVLANFGLTEAGFGSLAESLHQREQSLVRLQGSVALPGHGDEGVFRIMGFQIERSIHGQAKFETAK